MADEITMEVSLAVAKGGASIDSGAISDTITMSGSDMGTETGTATSTTALIATPASVGFSGAGAIIVVQNLGSALITIGVNNATPPTQVQATLSGGEVCVLNGVTAQPYIHAPSNTLYQVWACEK